MTPDRINQALLNSLIGGKQAADYKSTSEIADSSRNAKTQAMKD
jgi:hypothetical protein